MATRNPARKPPGMVLKPCKSWVINYQPQRIFSEKRRLFEGRRNGGGCFIGAKTVELWLCFSTTSSFKTKRFTWNRKCFKALERWTSSTGLIPKKRANVMIRFFWWSDPASLDTKEPKAMILFCQKKHIDSLNQSLACGNLKMWLKDTTNLGWHVSWKSKGTPGTMPQLPNSSCKDVVFNQAVFTSTQKFVQKKCLLLLMDKIQHLSIGIVDMVWVFIDVHSLSHWV